MILYLATQNTHKIQELSALLQGRFSVKSIAELGQVEDIPETGWTISENSLQKANFIAQKYKVTCLSDDSGLEVEALDGEPGVFSARYAGSQRNSKDNINLLLENLKNISHRSARFVTILTFHYQGNFYQFEGEIKGQIIDQPRGNDGFGYDPIFLPDGYTKTFAEMSMEEKNLIAHRAKAIEKFIKFIDEKTFFGNE